MPDFSKRLLQLGYSYRAMLYLLYNAETFTEAGGFMSSTAILGFMTACSTVSYRSPLHMYNLASIGHLRGVERMRRQSRPSLKT